MMPKLCFASLICVSLIGCTTPSTPMDTTAPTSIEKTLLLQSSSSWDGTPYTAYPGAKPELSVLKIKIPANSALGWHTHPIPNAAYVAQGEITIEIQGGKSKTFKQGEVLPEVVDTVHRGKTGNQPTELVIFYAGSPGIPLQH